MKKILLFALIITLGAGLQVFAQETYHLAQNNSSVVIKGTSTLHDWEMTAKNVSAKITVDKDGNSLKKIDNVYFSVSSDKIEGESSIMDNKAHDALKSKKYPNISFRMNTIDNLVSSGGTIKGSVNGEVTIAGVSKKITVPFSGTLSGNKIKISGEQSIKMSDFNIDPPTAMLGTLKTGNEIKVDYKLEFTN